MDKTKLRNDIILILSLLLVAAVTLIVLLTRTTPGKKMAHISVSNQEVEVIDLSKNEDKEYLINGTNGVLYVHTHDGAIAVIESNCPHQDCVRMGYVSTTNRPIICTYNAVYIIIEGDSLNDVEIK